MSNKLDAIKEGEQIVVYLFKLSAPSSVRSQWRCCDWLNAYKLISAFQFLKALLSPSLSIQIDLYVLHFRQTPSLPISKRYKKEHQKRFLMIFTEKKLLRKEGRKKTTSLVNGTRKSFCVNNSFLSFFPTPNFPSFGKQARWGWKGTKNADIK